jgi:hypothetical protein
VNPLQVEYRPAARRDLFQIHEYLNREVSLELGLHELVIRTVTPLEESR